MTMAELHLFCFQCPECGTSDGDLGHKVTADDPHCMVCFMDDGRIVRLRRWVASEEADLGKPQIV